MLHLIRHARPRQEPTVNPALWRLEDDAVDGLAILAGSGALPGDAFWCSSPEPKARATAIALAGGVDVEIVEDLREQDRPTGRYPDVGEFEATVARAMTQPDRPAEPGWEPAALTTRRVTAAVRNIMTRAGGRDVVLAGHGTAWTLLVAAITASPPDLDAWRRMAMPDHAVLDLATGQLVRRWGAWMGHWSDHGDDDPGTGARRAGIHRSSAG